MAKSLKAITQGAKKNEGKTWFAQLADKSIVQVCSVQLCDIYCYIQEEPSKSLCTGP